MFETNALLDRFILFEGIDGAGTSTQRKLLVEAMRVAGRRVLDSWEPTDGPIGSLVRAALKGGISLQEKSMALLFAADRHEHLHGANGIVKFLEDGSSWAISDRYFFSSLAYQSEVCGLDEVWSYNSGFPLPGRIIFIDTDTSIAARRRELRQEERERYEVDELLFRVRRNYGMLFDTLRKERPDCALQVIDGGLDAMQIHREICMAIGILPIVKG